MNITVNSCHSRVRRFKLFCKEGRNARYSGNPACEMGSYPSKKSKISVKEVSNDDGSDWSII